MSKNELLFESFLKSHNVNYVFLAKIVFTLVMWLLTKTVFTSLIFICQIKICILK